MVKAVLKFPFRVARKIVRRLLGRASAPTQTSKPTVDFSADPFPKPASADPFPAPASADPFPQPVHDPGAIPTTVKLATQDLFPEPAAVGPSVTPIAATPAAVNTPAEPVEAAPKAKAKKAKAEPKAAKEEPVKAKKKVDVRVIAEETPNPNAMKFVCSVKVMAKGSMSFGNAVVAQDHPLGKAVFAVPGVKSVFAVNDFVTVTKTDGASWIAIVEPLEQAIAAALSTSV